MPTYINGTLQTSSQGADAQLDTLAALTAAQVGGLVDLATLEAPASNGQFIVATGSGVFAYESGATALASVGGAPAAGSTSLTTTGNITAGSGSGDATVKSSGNHDLILQTGNTTTGNITIADGADGDITISPNGSGSAKVGSAIVRTSGTENIWIPAAAMTPRDNAGCAALATVAAGSSGRPDFHVLDFDKDSDEHAQFSIAMPKSWDGGNIYYYAYWIGIAATTGVAWGLEVLSLNDNEEFNQAYINPIIVQDDSQGDVTELLVSAKSAAIACSGADNDLLCFQVYRDVSDGNDDMSGDARLWGLLLEYTTNTSTDA